MSPYTTGTPSRPTREEIESRLTDLHYAIFERLPDEGRTLGFSPMVVTVKHLTDELNAALPPGAPLLRTPPIGAELRSLARFGLAVTVKSLVGSTLGWQRTAWAKELLAKRRREIDAHQTEEEIPPANVSSVFSRGEEA